MIFFLVLGHTLTYTAPICMRIHCCNIIYFASSYMYMYMLFLLKGPCFNGGIPNVNGTCSCPLGYAGDQCERYPQGIPFSNALVPATLHINTLTLYSRGIKLTLQNDRINKGYVI